MVDSTGPGFPSADEVFAKYIQAPGGYRCCDSGRSWHVRFDGEQGVIFVITIWTYHEHLNESNQDRAIFPGVKETFKVEKALR